MARKKKAKKSIAKKAPVVQKGKSLPDTKVTGSGKINTKEVLEEHKESIGEVLDRTGFRIDPYIMELMRDEPFLCAISRYIRKVPTLKIPTAGVGPAGDEIVMFFNPNLFTDLSMEETKGIIKHELYHVGFFHIAGRRQEPKWLWNVSADLAINSLIESGHSKHTLPDWTLLPGRMPASEGPEKADKNTRTLADVIVDMPLLKSSEWYMNRIREEAKEQGESGENPDGEFGQGINSWDDHDIWDGDGKNGSKEYYAGKIKEIVRRAANHADSVNGWGSVPADVREQIRRMVSNEVNWQAVLRRFVGITQGATWANSMKKINRKYPYVHPGRKRGRTARMAIAIDQSGSVSDDELELFFGELGSLSKRTTFTVIPFDHTVDEEHIFEWRRGQVVKAVRTRCGGTCFDCVTEYVNQNSDKYDGCILLTDGQAPQPGPCKVRRGWLLTPDATLYFKTDEQQIFMKRPYKKSV